MAILVGIDGTDDSFVNSKKRSKYYDENFRTSNISKLCKKGNMDEKYFRGPLAHGGTLMQSVCDGYDFIIKKYNETYGKVILTGYSRGATGVVMIAQKLLKKSIVVDAMLLFDCVDRYMFGDAHSIPKNVKNVYHAIRDPRSSSRESFSNDGMVCSNPATNMIMPMYMCTHGAMGGLPWLKPKGKTDNDYIDEGGIDGKTKIKFKDDWNKSITVWNDCLPFAKTFGFI